MRVENLKDSLTEMGGVGLAFAEFLLWRADLLEAEYLSTLRRMDRTIPPVPVEGVAALLGRELGPDGDELAQKMGANPLWSTRSRTAYLSQYKDSPVVVQVAREPVPESDLASFEANIRSMGHPASTRIAAPAILAGFRQWLRQSESCATERSYLEIISRSSGETLTEYPALISDITTDKVLCWRWVEGEPVSSMVGRGSVDAITQVAIAVFEQYCILSMVDGEFSLDAMVRPAGKQHLTVRRFNRPIEVPPAMVDIGMKYFAAVLEGNASMTAQTLANLALGRSVASLEHELLGFLAATEPDLKGDLWFPGAAGAFESNWRALAKLKVNRPLYLDCLHRNLIATGYWTADAIYTGGKAIDTITEAHWPVLERVFKTNATRFLNPAVMAEWLISLGMMGLRGIREAGRLAEEVRDNNLTMEVEIGESQNAPAPRTGYNVWTGLLIACLLAILLAMIRWGSAVGLSQGVAAAVGFAAMVALFWLLARPG